MKGRHNLVGKRSIMAKMKSQRGVSMPLALLLFLICAMTASIVLAAGTAAAGRAANLADTDQAYYSTTSAINLFRDQLAGPSGQGHEITVAVKRAPSGSSASYQVLVTTDGVASNGTLSLLERAAISVLFGGKNAQTIGDAQSAATAYFTSNAWDSWPQPDSAANKNVGTFTLTHAGSLDATQEKALEIEVEAKTDGEGDLVLTFQKPGQGSGDAKDYLSIFNMTCSTDIESGDIDATESGSDVKVKYATITWIPSNVEKG